MPERYNPANTNTPDCYACPLYGAAAAEVEHGIVQELAISTLAQLAIEKSERMVEAAERERATETVSEIADLLQLKHAGNPEALAKNLQALGNVYGYLQDIDDTVNSLKDRMEADTRLRADGYQCLADAATTLHDAVAANGCTGPSRSLFARTLACRAEVSHETKWHVQRLARQQTTQQ